jgi:hypothetical protein
MVWRSCKSFLGFYYNPYSFTICEQTYNVLWATMEHFLRQGLISDSKVLDIRQVDVRVFLSIIATSA